MSKRTMIENGIKTILEDRFDLSADFSSEKVMDAHLLGSPMQLSPSDLIYLFFDIETLFGIRISEEDITSGRFSTLKGIFSIVENQLEAATLSGSQA